MLTRPQPTTAAEAFLMALKANGVDYLFANAGTDFTPLIEAFAKASALGLPAPKPIAVPHENVAMAMAMGIAMAIGIQKSITLVEFLLK